MSYAWTPDPVILGEKWDSYSPEHRERALLLATSTLTTLTSGRVGAPPETIRPERQCLSCAQHRPCGCGWTNHSEIELPGPVGAIHSLRIDGEEYDLTTGDFRLDNGHILVWQGLGPSPIPATQDLSKPDTEPGTWSITYSRSHPVGADGRVAVSLLALEYAAAMQPRGKCSLPKGVTSVVRNGVSFTVEAGLFPNGLTGIELADQFILKWLPVGAPIRTAVVFDPRRATPRRTGALPGVSVSGNAPLPIPLPPDTLDGGNF